MNIGWLVLSNNRTAVRRLCGQFPAAGKEIRSTRDADFQHKERSEANSAQTGSGNLTACRNPVKRGGRHLVQIYFAENWNKMMRLRPKTLTKAAQRRRISGHAASLLVRA